MWKYILLWFPMLVIAIINGMGREWYKAFTEEFTARQISTVTLLVFFGFYIFWVIKKYPLKNETQAIVVGLVWLFLTLLFEFGFGLYRGNTLSQLLEDYNILKGKLWILIPIWISAAPYIFYKFSTNH